MDRLTAEDVRGLSRVDFAEKEFGDGDDTPDLLEPVVESANTYVEWVTGWVIDANLPTVIEPLIRDAVRMRTEQLVEVAQADNVETAGDIDLVASFTAGSYSETRRDPGSVGNKSGAGMGIINPWPQLNQLLWLLLGTSTAFPSVAVDERFDYWRMLLSGVNGPAWQVVEVDWNAFSRTPYGYEPTYAGDGFENL